MKFEFCLNKSLNSPQILTHSGHVLEQAPTIYYSIWFIWTVQYLICILESFWWSQRVCLLQPGPSQPTLWRSVRVWRTGGLQTSPTYQTQMRRISLPHWWDFTAKTTEFIQFGECDCVSHNILWFHCLCAFQVAGRYRVMVESSMASSDDIIFNCGDVIQLLHEELSGLW